MYSILIISQDKAKREAFALHLCQTYSIDPFDIFILETESSIGIEDVRKLQQKLFLKPYKSTDKASIIHDAHMLTIEAQNALLKILEEPPDHTYIILSAENQDRLLPTIISRCQLIALETKVTELNEQDGQELSEVFQSIQTGSSGDKLYHAQKIGINKESALAWLEKAILNKRNQMLHGDLQSEQSVLHIEYLEKLQDAHRMIKTTNVSPRFVLEKLFLSL